MRARIISRLQRVDGQRLARFPPRSMRARIISRLQHQITHRRLQPPMPLNEGQDYIPATTSSGLLPEFEGFTRSMRARIISRLQHVDNRDRLVAQDRSMRARIISRLQRRTEAAAAEEGGPLNEGQDYIPATTSSPTSRRRDASARSMRARIISRLQLRG